MTRKDYIAIAKALYTVHDKVCQEHAQDTNPKGSYVRGTKAGMIIGVSMAVSAVAVILEEDNPRFDREHFLAVVRGERELTSRPPRKAA